MKQFFEGRIISDLCKVFGSVLLAAGLCCSISAQEDFFLATHNGNAELVKKMISRGANVNMKTDIGFTPLMVAAGDGHANIVKMLINAKADIDAANKDGYTALYFAAVRKHPNAVKVLLDAGASILLNTKDGESTVLEYKMDDESRDLLVEKFFGDNICFAAYWGSIKLVKKLLAQGKNVNMKQGKGGLTPLMFAITKGHTEIVKLLIAAKADVNLQNSAGETPLMVAVGGDDTQIVKILLDAGADINLKDKEGRTVLNYKMNDKSRALIMEKAAAGDILQAARDGNAAQIRKMLASKVDVNTRNDHGITALIIASIKGDAEIVKLLIAANADVNAQDEDGFTAIFYAANRKHPEIVKILLDAGADIRVKDKKGRTVKNFRMDAQSRALIDGKAKPAKKKTNR